MDLHGSAALSRRGRRRLVGLVAGGMTVTAAAVIVGCSRQTGSKWVNRARRGEGLEDRSSRPHRSPRRVSAVVEQAVLGHVASFARGRMWSAGRPACRPRPCMRFCAVTAALDWRLVRLGGDHPLPARPAWRAGAHRRKEAWADHPAWHRVTGDRRQRARGNAGWQHLFVAIDDATRLAYAELYPDETNASAISFLAAAQRFYQEHRITIERVLTDNGTCFKQRWSQACAERQITAKRTRPYRPQTNGKAERFIRTLLDRWAYAEVYPPSTTSPRPTTRAPHLQSQPTTPRPRRADATSARQRPIWDNI